MINEGTTGMTPDGIASKLFSYHAKAHFLHLQTMSFAKHKMLDELYSSIDGLKDSICEYLLGCQAPKRFGTITIEQVGSYSDAEVTKFLDEGFAFTVKLCDYAETKGYEQLCNLSSELQGSFKKAKYLNTLD